MKISILTLFPQMFSGPFDESIIARAKEKKQTDIALVQIRDFGIGNHKTVDDRPYGGGTGMVLRVDVLDRAIQSVRNPHLLLTEEQCILLDARGEVYTQEHAKQFARLKHLILVCGHYEGVDERIRQLVDQTISIGDFILTGGEIPAMVITDSVVRLIDGVLKSEATVSESFTNPSILEYPQYTQPREYKGKTVPEILLSGNHKLISDWKKEQSDKITRTHRPDLLK